VGFSDGMLQEKGACHARARADEVEREPDEAEPVRASLERGRVGLAYAEDDLCLDTCDERALGYLYYEREKERFFELMQ
jgi:hypothetical protein